ncbi:MAG: hypothetical protein KDE09_17345 [Anaerolineales bacterium]|nr:hypothetical protein [Anaerolineales bacterium]MCB0007926.1 hypothetical protein [Anaerolineales bacterium]MCB0015163.1 hypothetical protein [Anaerolineales bacterium]MCB0019562.1 hypothetical protein [Anaerolineales bacterium]MCB8961318.1 hypothetical protein [Ardenticatenales bacterium]
MSAKSQLIIRPRLLVGIFLLLLLLALTGRSQAALAHGREVVGDYVFVLGWLSEPPVVGERNALLLEIEHESSGAPVTGAEADLTTELVYADQTLRVNLIPSAEEPGRYTADLIPTVRGTFSVRLIGLLDDTEIDLLMDADEVFPATRLQFPETAPDTLTVRNEMQAQIDLLTADLRSARLIAYIGPIIGFLSLILGALGLRKASQSGDTNDA